ncbi:hypothetical protein, partial [Salmonella sp. SAL4356]|uniref:hypothetical protein n=1 Tax=Salmonella sp. SAL4356 TaxID=3159877 RepID=UPI0039799307
LATGLQRAAALARPRAALDEQGWAALRNSCPTTRNRPGLDLLMARQILADPRRYEAALHALPGTGRQTIETASVGPQR